MAQENCKIFNWNVRGLNSLAKREAVRILIQEHKATIACLQETKLQSVDQRIASQILGARLSNSFCFLPADGTRGGIILAVDDNFFSISNHTNGNFSLTTQIAMKAENISWEITVVYGPQEDPQKIAFRSEIEQTAQSISKPWLVIGDFNLIYKVFDKNNNRLDRSMMQRFKAVIDILQIKELPLQGRKFTWAATSTNPTQTKIDRAFCSTEWDLLFHSASLVPLSSSCSDHAPLLIIGEDIIPRCSSFRFEAY